jgi:filamentous hemagglutinin
MIGNSGPLGGAGLDDLSQAIGQPLEVENNAAGLGEHSDLRIKVVGAGGGDPRCGWWIGIAGSRRWTAGVDNSDGDAWKLATGTTSELGTGTILKITTTGVGTWTGDLAVTGALSGGTFTVGTLTGVLKATAGALSTATPNSDYTAPLGVAGGQTIAGGTGAGETLTLTSTAHATKGNIYLGSATGFNFDCANTRLGIGVAPVAGTDLYILKTSADAGSTNVQFGNSNTNGKTQIYMTCAGGGVLAIAVYGSTYATIPALQQGASVSNSGSGPLQLNSGGQTKIGAGNVIRVMIAAGGVIDFQGNTVCGGDAAAGNFLQSSTTNATKGFWAVGSATTGLIYDETNVRLGIGAAPLTTFYAEKTTAANGGVRCYLQNNQADGYSAYQAAAQGVSTTLGSYGNGWTGGTFFGESVAGSTVLSCTVGTVSLIVGTAQAAPVKIGTNNAIRAVIASDGKIDLQANTLHGGSASGGNFLQQSTTHGTKGTWAVGSTTTGLVYDETNARLGVGMAPGAYKLQTATGDVKLDGATEITGRLLGAKGADVTGASTITLGVGNYFKVNCNGGGMVNVDFITTTGWTAGSKVTLQVADLQQITNNASTPPANTAVVLMNGGAAFLPYGQTGYLQLQYNGTAWVEIGRSLI